MASAARALKQATRPVSGSGIGRNGARAAERRDDSTLMAAARPSVSIVFVASARVSTGSGSGCRTGSPVVTASSVGGEEPAEHGRGADDGGRLAGRRVEPDDERREQDGCDGEADAGAGALRGSDRGRARRESRR